MPETRVRHGSIYDPIRRPRDGYRLLVTRYWPRGVRKSAVDGWNRALGAPLALIRSKKAGRLDRASLRKRYLASLDPDAFDQLLGLARRRRVTLLCTCRDDLCHRVILADRANRALKGRAAGSRRSRP